MTFSCWNLALVVGALLSTNSHWAMAETALVTKASGEVVRVAELHAVYLAGGHWIGDRPSQSASSLHAILQFKDRTTESFEVPFSETREINIERRPGPLGPGGAWVEIVHIRRRDGSIVTLSLNFETRDSRGGVTRAVSLNAYTLAAGLTLDQQLVLNFLDGSEVMADGSRRPFRLSWSEVKAVRFE